MIKHFIFYSVLLIFFCSTTGTVLAADIAAGEAKTKMCQTCHGKDGISPMPQFPNLAGQNAFYTAQQLKAFRDGKRQNENMTVVVQNLSDTDIENIAAYYESLGSGCGCQ